MSDREIFEISNFMAKSQKIRDLREADRPREKLLAKGAEALSDQELLAILLGKGTAEMDIMTMAGKILDVLSKNGEEAGLDELQNPRYVHRVVRAQLN